jgi:uncharacterized membrane protein
MKKRKEVMMETKTSITPKEKKLPVYRNPYYGIFRTVVLIGGCISIVKLLNSIPSSWVSDFFATYGWWVIGIIIVLVVIGSFLFGKKRNGSKLSLKWLGGLILLIIILMCFYPKVIFWWNGRGSSNATTATETTTTCIPERTEQITRGENNFIAGEKKQYRRIVGISRFYTPPKGESCELTWERMDAPYASWKCKVIHTKDGKVLVYPISGTPSCYEGWYTVSSNKTMSIKVDF